MKNLGNHRSKTMRYTITVHLQSSFTFFYVFSAQYGATVNAHIIMFATQTGNKTF